MTSILAALIANACATASTDSGGDVTGDQPDTGTGDDGGSPGDDSGQAFETGGGQDSAGGCVVGATCSTNSGAPCLIGVTACSLNNTQSCVDSTFAAAGVACGAGKACDGEGNCLAGGGDGGTCTPGGACTTNPGAPCKTGAIGCSGNVASCDDNGNAAQGTSCGGANTCDGNGNCVAPDGGACTPGGTCSSNPGAPCKTGVVTCNGGVAGCGDNGNAAQGTSCGAGKVCDGNGACVATPDGGGGTCHIVINELQTAGAGGASDEWIEIHNPCSNAIDVTGWKLVYRSAGNNSGGSDTTLLTFATLTIPAGVYVLYAGSGYTGTKDGTFSNGLAATGGAVGLKNAAGTLVDSVAYQTLTTTNNFTEGSPAPNPPSAQSIGRHPDGADTNNNATDFKVYTTPSPRAANP